MENDKRGREVHEDRRPLRKTHRSWSTIDKGVVAAFATPIGRAFMLPEEWSSRTAPYLGQRGSLNTWLATEKIAYDVGGSTSPQDVTLESSMRVRDIHLDVRYPRGYIELKLATDALVAYRAEDFANIRDSTGVRIQFLAIRGHITGLLAANIDHATDCGFRPTILSWMDVWELGPVFWERSFAEWLLEQMFSCDGDECRVSVSSGMAEISNSTIPVLEPFPRR